MVAIKRLSTVDADFTAKMDALLAFEAAADEGIERTVANILADVKQRGDTAVVDYTNKFDRLTATSMADLELSKAEMQKALDGLPADRRSALEAAAGRIRAYHERQKMEGWSYTEADGTMLGQMITPLDRVGLYVPGGKAAYPSSVLMNAIPAKVAGVKELIMVVPTPGGEHNQLVLAAACLAGVDRVFTMGGAQAVGALAYGTQTVPQVDKIVGPGNAYVATAKRRVFGIVGIDMVAGPSEILVVSDGSGNPDWVAMDLFSQAEHDELAQSILICTDAAFIERVQASIDKLLPTMPRRAVIETSLTNRGALAREQYGNFRLMVSSLQALETLQAFRRGTASAYDGLTWAALEAWPSPETAITIARAHANTSELYGLWQQVSTLLPVVRGKTLPKVLTRYAGRSEGTELLEYWISAGFVVCQ